MWYVLQTQTGREQETVDAIDRILAGKCYEKCFLIRRECVWRIEGDLRIHVEPLFPSYVFVEISEDAPAEEFFRGLKRVPKLTRLLGSADGGEGYAFGTVEREEEELLRRMMGAQGDYIVRRSPVKVNGEGGILWAGGALSGYTERIVKKRLRKRFVTVEIPFLGRTRRVQMGIRLEGDP